MIAGAPIAINKGVFTLNSTINTAGRIFVVKRVDGPRYDSSFYMAGYIMANGS